MTEAFAHACTTDAHFSFTKLVVDDLDRAHAFYTTVCGLVEQFRYDSEIGERGISEICYAPTGPGGGSFTLLKYLDGRRPASDEVIVGFTTSDIDAFFSRAEAAGGSIVNPARYMPDLNLRVGFVADCEGHLIEVVEMG